MFNKTIERCYDSHVHWLATGEMSLRLNLFDLQSAADILYVKIHPSALHEGWVIGFGWDHNRWSQPGQPAEFPHRRILDQWCPDRPVVLSRADGHAFWVNTKALELAGLIGEHRRPFETETADGRIVLDAEGMPSGVLIDRGKAFVERAMPQVRPVRQFLLEGSKIFHQAGYTHIRDLSGTEEQWQQACLLADANELKLAVEQFFIAEKTSDFDQALKTARWAKLAERPHLKAKGVKIYFDGALGSEGAYLSRPYLSGSGRGFRCLTDQELEEQIRLTFAADLELAIHVIGDEAAAIATTTAQKVWRSGIKGHLHLEHVELLRPETIHQLRRQTVTCHMQPCHWLNDRKWLRAKIGDLSSHAFRWRALEDNQISLFFGSDTPIEKPSVKRNMQALQESATDGIPPLRNSIESYFVHPDPNFAPRSSSRFINGTPAEVIFMGEKIL
jgi:predicted amidohydrolase YtcJ